MFHGLTSAPMRAFWQALPPLSERTVTCVGIRLEADPDVCSRTVEPFVSATERQRATRYVHAIDAARHLLGRFIVRSVLTRTLGARWITSEFEMGSKGKPGLVGSGIDFSISHSGSWVWAAFCREAAVGIDVEEVRRLDDLDDLIDVLHPVEAAAIREVAADEAHTAFFRCWTRKEALLKALGEGMARRLDSFCVGTSVAADNWLIGIRDGYVEEWSCFDVPVFEETDCQVALAAQAPGLKIAVARLPIFWA